MSGKAKKPDNYILECMQDKNISNLKSFNLSDLKNSMNNDDLSKNFKEEVIERFFDLKMQGNPVFSSDMAITEEVNEENHSLDFQKSPNLDDNNYQQDDRETISIINDEDSNNTEYKSDSYDSLDSSRFANNNRVAKIEKHNNKDDTNHNLESKTFEEKSLSYNERENSIASNTDSYYYQRDKLLNEINKNITHNQKYYRSKTKTLPLKEVLISIVSYLHTHKGKQIYISNLFTHLQSTFNVQNVHKKNLEGILGEYFGVHNENDIDAYECFNQLSTYFQNNHIKDDNKSNYELHHDFLSYVHQNKGINTVKSIFDELTLNFYDQASVLKEYENIIHRVLKIKNTNVFYDDPVSSAYCYIKAYEFLGIYPDNQIFFETYINYKNFLTIYEKITASIKKISEQNSDLNLETIIDKSLFDKLNRHGLKKVRDLQKDLNLDMFVEILPELHVLDNKIANLQYDFKLEFINDIFSSIKDKDFKILSLRADYHTLKMVGEVMNLTRERVRQIEDRALEETACNLQAIMDESENSLKHIFKNEYFITYDELKQKVPEYYQTIIYIMRMRFPTRILKDKHINFSNHDWLPMLEKYLYGLPEILDKSDFENKIDELRTSLEKQSIVLDESTLKMLINSEYKNTFNNFLSKQDLSFRFKCKVVLKHHFLSGIHITTDEGLKDFRRAYAHDFSDEIYDKTDRNIISAISEVGVQLKRGTYGPKEAFNFNNENLFKRVVGEIKSSDVPVTYRGLYEKYKTELNDSDINDYAQLHALLKERLSESEGFFLKRSSVNFGDQAISSVDAIYNYIKNTDEYVTFDELFETFPTFNESQVKNIINSHKELIQISEDKAIAVSKLEIAFQELKKIKGIIKEMITEQKVVDYRNLYSYILSSNNQLLDAFPSSGAKGFYNTLQTLLKDDFKFYYPYITDFGTETIDKHDLPYQYAYSRDEIQLDDLSDYAEKNHIILQDKKEFIENLYPDYIRIHKNRLIKSKLFNLTVDELSKIKYALIALFMYEETVDLGNISLFRKYMPNIGFEWNMYLLASIIKKYFNGITIEYTSNNYDKGSIIVRKTKQKINFNSTNPN